jgi:DNA-binding SARP family transcriptional activator
MDSLRIRMFGRLRVELDARGMVSLNARKLQELLGYLFIFRNRPHPREILASLFWENYNTPHSKKCLRQSLWLLQGALDQPDSSPLLVLEDEWVRINPEASYWLDVDQFESIYTRYLDVPSSSLNSEDLQQLHLAAGLYQGNLLEGFYSDWCIFERERLQNQYILLLDKLIQCCEFHRAYESGLEYAKGILRLNRSYEHAHYGMMRLYFLSGRRSEAVRQYEQCAQALQEELDVHPSRRTRALYELILSDRIDSSLAALPPPSSYRAQSSTEESLPTLDKAREWVQDLYGFLENLAGQSPNDNYLTDR